MKISQAFLHAENISDLIIKHLSTIQNPRTLKLIILNKIKIKRTSTCKNENKMKANKTLHTPLRMKLDAGATQLNLHLLLGLVSR